MKLELGDNFAMSISVCWIVLFLFLFLGSIVVSAHFTKKGYIENGYEQVQLEGGQIVWQKRLGDGN